MTIHLFGANFLFRNSLLSEHSHFVESHSQPVICERNRCHQGCQFAPQSPIFSSCRNSCQAPPAPAAASRSSFGSLPQSHPSALLSFELQPADASVRTISAVETMLCACACVSTRVDECVLSRRVLVHVCMWCCAFGERDDYKECMSPPQTVLTLCYVECINWPGF